MHSSTLFETVKQFYSFHIHDQTPAANGYILHTNCGPKLMTLNEDEVLLHWSFLWREELAKRGFRLIDRFIRTKDEASFISLPKQSIVIRDFREESSFPLSVPAFGVKPFHAVGQILGLMYQTVKDLDQKYTEHRQFTQWKMEKNKEQPFYAEEDFLALKKRISTEEETYFLQLVKSNWKGLEQRWKHTHLLLKQKQAKLIPPFEPTLSFFYLYQDKCLGYYARNITTSHGLMGVAQMMQDVFIWADGNFNDLQDFWLGFEAAYPLSLEEHYEILAWLIFPHQFFRMIEEYFQQVKADEDCLKDWAELCQKQTQLDQLQLWYAEKTDRLREDAVSV